MVKKCAYMPPPYAISPFFYIFFFFSLFKIILYNDIFF